MPGLDFGGPADDSRDPDGFFPGLPFQTLAVGAEHVAVVGTDHKDGVFGETELVQFGHEATDLVIDGVQHSVVFRESRSTGGTGAVLIVRAEFEFFGVEFGPIFSRGLVGIVRRAHLDGQEEGPAVGFGSVEEFEGEVGPAFGLELLHGDGGWVIAEVLGVEVGVAALVGGPEFETLTAGAGGDEAGEAFTSVEVPFADETGAVTGFGEEFRDGDLGFAEAEVVGGHAVLAGVFAGEEDGSGRAADGGVGDGVLQQDSLAGETVEVRCNGIFVAHTAERLGAQLVGEEEDDIGARGLGSREESSRGGGGKEFSAIHHAELYPLGWNVVILSRD